MLRSSHTEIEARASMPAPEPVVVPPHAPLPDFTDSHEVSPNGSVPPPPASAIVPPDDEHETIAHDFFSKGPRSSYPSVWPDDPHGARASKPHRPPAMLAALGMLGVSLVVIGAFAAYNQWIMPEPVELGAGSSLQLPVAAPPLTAAVESSPPPAAALNEPAPSPEPITAPEALAPIIAPPTVSASAVATAVTPTTAPSYDELVSVGRVLSKRGRVKEAIEAYQQALTLRPEAAEPLARLGYFQLNAGAFAAAKGFAARAVMADPTSSEGWIVLGSAQASLGDQAAARAAYRKCAALGVGPYVRECEQLAR